MNIRVLYFARIREAVGISDEQIALAQPTATVADLLTQLKQRGEQWRTALAEPLKFAVNQQFAAPTAVITDGAEVAIFPPVTGG